MMAIFSREVLRSALCLLGTLVAAAPAIADTQRFPVLVDGYTAAKIEEIIDSAVVPSGSASHGDIVAQVSAFFLDTPYQANMLIGSPAVPEALVADFNRVDCFTLIDYVEALSRSANRVRFLQNLAAIRYVGGEVAYQGRRHFFSDWYAEQTGSARDVTREVGPFYASAEKTLNRKPGGGEYVAGLGTISRTINYIPSHTITEQTLDRLQTGDYVGVYSPLAGLDVTHVGIVIKNERGIWFRNASSRKDRMKVEDAPLLAYMASKPGMIVVRTE